MTFRLRAYIEYKRLLVLGSEWDDVVHKLPRLIFFAFVDFNNNSAMPPPS